MSCDGNRDAYFAVVSGSGSAAAQAFGGPEAARQMLTGQITAGQWAAVTSLVAAHELPALLAGDRRDELLRAMGLL